MVENRGSEMRYYGPISHGRVTFVIACALGLSVALNLPASVTFVAHWGTVLSELKSRQAEARLAAFKYYVAGTADQGRGYHRAATTERQ